MRLPIALAQVIAEQSQGFLMAAAAVLGVGFVAAASIGSIAWFQSKRQFWWQAKRDGSGVEKGAGPHYDPGIIPNENRARQQREGELYKQTPQPAQGDANVAEGFTVDREGLLNNYAVMPEPYIEEPGDLAEQERAAAEQRRRELDEVAAAGGRGPGVI